MALAVVAGAAGFIGSHVKNAFERRGDTVIALGRGTERPEVSGAALAALGVRPDLIFYCSGGSSVGKSIEAPLADFANTVPPFVELLDYVRTSAVAAKVVLLSSAAVYGNAETIPTDEATVPRPISPYGYHKKICEDLCLAYGANYGVQTAIVRLFSVYGSGLRKQLLWDGCTKASTGKRRFFGTGEELRDWLHIDDAVALIARAADLASAGATILNGGTGVGTPIAQVVGELFRALGAGTPEFIGNGRPGDPTRYVADIARARATGWAPQVELARGLSEYIRWFQAQS